MRLARYCALAACIFPVMVAVSGCGAGSDAATRLTGVVTDVDGKAVAGASVSCSGKTTTSLSNGTFVLAGLPSGIRTVLASITIEGRRWSGESRVDLALKEKTRSLNVVVSDDRYHARLTGTVIDASGYPLEGAKVFVGGPWGSTLGVTSSTGSYDIRRLTPGVTYTVTCSLAGFINDTRTIHLSDNQSGNLSFALDYGSSQGTIPAPANLAAQAWTIADRITRSPQTTPSYIEWLKRLFRARRGLPSEPRVVSAERPALSRATPPGSIVEVDLFWDYQSWDDLLGYAVKRGVSSPPSTVTAVLRDPLAASFFDVDDALTPDTVYYYTVHSLDTIDFPARGTVGPRGDIVSANPLQPMQATSPAQSETVTGDPLFRWTAVAGAAYYQVIVWNRFPDLQNPDDPQGAAPLWPADPSAPGASKVSAPATSLGYSGPYLQAGRTYYWLVVAADQGELALSVSPIRKFVAR